MALDQPIGIEPGCLDRQPEPREQSDLAVHDVARHPAEPLRQSALGDHSDRDRFAVPERPVVAGDGLDRMGDRMAEIEQRPLSAFLPLIPRDDARLDPAALQDDVFQRAVRLAPRISPAIPLEKREKR